MDTLHVSADWPSRKRREIMRQRALFYNQQCSYQKALPSSVQKIHSSEILRCFRYLQEPFWVDPTRWNLNFHTSTQCGPHLDNTFRFEQAINGASKPNSAWEKVHSSLTHGLTDPTKSGSHANEPNEWTNAAATRLYVDSEWIESASRLNVWECLIKPKVDPISGLPDQWRKWPELECKWRIEWIEVRWVSLNKWFCFV